MGLVEELLGCPLLEVTRSYWAVRLITGEWICEARAHTDLSRGGERHFDWSNDLVATGDVLKIEQLWLLCPPSRTSPLGNTAHLDITEPGTAFQFKIATADCAGGTISRHLQAHIIGKVLDKEKGDCSIFAWDEQQQGLITPETLIYNPATGGIRLDLDGNPIYAGRNNVYFFHGWRESMADPGRLELGTLGVQL